MTYRFESEIYLWSADESWHFVSLPSEISSEISEVAAVPGAPRRGFGAVRVAARLGKSSFRTSIFPDSKRKTYILPLKAAVRKAESVAAGDTVEIELELVDY